MNVIVWSKPNCVQCDATKRYLTKHEVPYEAREMTPDMIEEFKDKGFMSAPIVATGKDMWAGFRMSKLEGLVKEYKSEQIHKSA